MNPIIRLAVASCCLAIPSSMASAATIQLDSITSNGTDFAFTYGGTLAPTEGVKSGSQLVIYDFVGYVAGSIASLSSLISASVALTSPGLLLAPGVTDDPSLFNLIFTYTGPNFQTTPAPIGSPYAPIAFGGLTARSIFGSVGLDGFSTLTVKNTGLAGVGTDVFSAGFVGVPTIPEPATWMMMILGIGAIGLGMRRRPNIGVAFS